VGQADTSFSRFRVYIEVVEGLVRNLELCVHVRVWCHSYCVRRKCFFISIKYSADRQQASNGELAYDGSTTFYASAIPSGQTQITVSTEVESVSVTFQWQST
jgi:hypothetical protein